MPRGDKSSYTNKQKRQARHIEEGYEDRGVRRKEAARRAWATVNKETGGGRKSGSGRARAKANSTSRKTNSRPKRGSSSTGRKSRASRRGKR
jgi:plasmid stabilization system protein ParE